MPPLKRAALPVVVLTLLGISSSLLAQRPLCNQLPDSDRDRARAAGSCRDPAPIIDVAPAGQRSDGSMVRVPRVTNININEARQRLQKDLDLKPQPVVVTSELRVGTVIEQEPPEGTLVKRGSAVRLHVSAGQEGPQRIEVPNVVGMPLARAQSRLARFTVERADRLRGERGNSAPEGQVIEQSQRAGSRAAAGSVIVLTVSGALRTRLEVFEMPNVVGRTYADSLRALSEFKVARTDVDSLEPRGQIIAQTPVAGSTLLPGDAVALQVSAGLASSTAATANGKAAAGTAATPSASNGASDVLAGVLSISAAVVLGLIAGGLMMRQWLSRRAAVAAADDAITSMAPPPAPQITSVDILLEKEPAPSDDTLETPQQK